MKKFHILLIFFIVLITGCAQVKVTKIGGTEEGIRFYRPHPYLLVTYEANATNKLKPVCSIVWLPNMKDEYTIKVTPGIGAIETGFTLQNGWNLTQFGNKTDSKVPETLNAISGILDKIKPGVLEAAFEPKEIRPGLYRFEFDATTGYFTELKLVPMSDGSDTAKNN